MKKAWLLIILGVTGIMGCSQQSGGTQAATATIAPYELTDDDWKVLDLAATALEGIFVYKVDAKNINIDAKIDHYKNGTLVDTIATLSGETTDKGELISFGSRTISPETQDSRQWFITIQGTTTITALEEVEPGGAMLWASMSDKKTLSQDEYSVVGALAQNRPHLSVGISSLEDELDTLLQENEDVYVFSCKLP